MSKEENVLEILKLKEMLEKANIPFEYSGDQIVVFDKDKKRIFFCSSKCMNEYKKYNDRIELFNSILGND